MWNSRNVTLRVSKCVLVGPREREDGEIEKERFERERELPCVLEETITVANVGERFTIVVCNS